MRYTIVKIHDKGFFATPAFHIKDSTNEEVSVAGWVSEDLAWKKCDKYNALNLLCPSVTRKIRRKVDLDIIFEDITTPYNHVITRPSKSGTILTGNATELSNPPA